MVVQLVLTEGNPANNNNPAHGFDSGFLSQGMTFQHMFNNAGTIEYYCSIHPYNNGKSNRISLVKNLWEK
jgi:plastocyanin